MKRLTAIAILILVASTALFAVDDRNVLVTTQEITAYKYLNPEEDEEMDITDPTDVTFKIYETSSKGTEVNTTGGDRKLTSTVITPDNYASNNTFSSAFYWEMTGTLFKQTIKVDFLFGPLSADEIAPSNTMVAPDANRVIPYTVTMKSNQTNMDGVGNLIEEPIAFEDLDKKTKGDYYTFKKSNYDSYRVYPAEKKGYLNNSALISTTSNTVHFTCSLFDYSFAVSERWSWDEDNKRDSIESSNKWTRSGYAEVVLGLDPSGYSWTETVEGSSVKHLLPSENLEYKANVLVTITVE